MLGFLHWTICNYSQWFPWNQLEEALVSKPMCVVGKYCFAHQRKKSHRFFNQPIQCCRHNFNISTLRRRLPLQHLTVRCCWYPVCSPEAALHRDNHQTIISYWFHLVSPFCWLKNTYFDGLKSHVNVGSNPFFAQGKVLFCRCFNLQCSFVSQAMKMPHDRSTSKKSYDKSGNKELGGASSDVHDPGIRYLWYLQHFITHVMYIHTYIHTYKHTNIQTYIHTYMYRIDTWLILGMGLGF